MPLKRSSKAVLAAKGGAALMTAAKAVLNSRSRGKGGSSTTSLLKRKVKFQQTRRGGPGTSSFTHKAPLPKYMKQVFKQNCPQVYVSNSSSRLTTPAGQQAQSNYTSLTGNTTAGDFTGGDMGAILNQLYGGAPTGNQKSTRLYIHKALTNYMFTNNQTNNIFVDIYDVVARRDGQIGMSTAFSNGLIDQGLALGGNAVNVTPFMSEQFTQHWKVLKKISIELGPGESHRHILSVHLNKVWNAERMQDAQTNYQGLTHGVLIVAHGAPDHDATTVTNVSTGSVLLDIVQSRQITWTYSTVALTTTKYVNALPTLTTERCVNEESGAAATVSS